MKKSLVRLAVAVVAIFALMAGTAAANHVFGDVAHGAFYSTPAEWAADNAITNGCGGGNFCPNNPVTRGENITFAYRYDQNVVQPALATIPTFHFAAVAPNGSLMASSSGATAEALTSAGNFRVRFPASVVVGDCIATTTIGATQIGSGTASGMVGITQIAGEPRGVFVRTYDENGVISHQPFTVQLMCPPATAAALTPGTTYLGNGEPQE